MEAASVSLINKMDAWFIELIIFGIIVWSLYYLPRLRFNKGADGVRSIKNGFYFKSKSVQEFRDWQKELKGSIEKIDKRLDDMTHDQLKILIYGESQPKKERFIAGVRYWKLGYNSNTKNYIRSEFIAKDKSLWSTCWDLIKIEGAIDDWSE